MSDRRIVLCIGEDHTAADALRREVDFEVYIARVANGELDDATSYMQGCLNILALVITDSDNIQDHINFLAEIKPYFLGPIVIVGHDLGLDQVLMRVGGTHHISDVHLLADLLRHEIRMDTGPPNQYGHN